MEGWGSPPQEKLSLGPCVGHFLGRSLPRLIVPVSWAAGCLPATASICADL